MSGKDKRGLVTVERNRVGIAILLKEGGYPLLVGFGKFFESPVIVVIHKATAKVLLHFSAYGSIIIKRYFVEDAREAPCQPFRFGLAILATFSVGQGRRAYRCCRG